jgi:hypothetical protein
LEEDNMIGNARLREDLFVRSQAVKNVQSVIGLLRKYELQIIIYWHAKPA